MQYQFHKVLTLVLTKEGSGVPEALLTQPLLLQLFNMLQMPLQEILKFQKFFNRSGMIY